MEINSTGLPRILEQSSKATNTAVSGLDVLRGQLGIRPVDAGRTCGEKSKISKNKEVALYL